MAPTGRRLLVCRAAAARRRRAPPAHEALRQVPRRLDGRARANQHYSESVPRSQHSPTANAPRERESQGAAMVAPADVPGFEEALTKVYRCHHVENGGPVGAGRPPNAGTAP